MTPKFRAWLKEEYKMTDVREITFFNDEVQMISDVEGFYAYDEFELMQSTGNKDKNGKEIFEGDIVRYTDGDKECLCPVRYIKDYSCFGIEWGSGFLVTFEYLDSFYTKLGYLEVIGNIYENPELLKGK